jgi:O-succinylhomoserine sulfhydrylase
MAVIYSVVIAHFKRGGGSIIVSPNVFGSTNVLFEKFVRKFNIDVRHVVLLDLKAWTVSLIAQSACCF